MQNYIAALLSNITYLKTEDYTLNSDGKMIIFDIEKSGITSSELSFFNSNFSVEYQKNGTEGFSVMKIVALKTSDFLGIQEGQVTLAFRGTEAFLDDWITDLGMGMKALSDIVPKIINEGSQYIPGLIGILRNLGNLPIWNEYFKSQSQQALEYFNIEKNISANMTLVGHSLGGYLANYVTTTGDNYTYINETRTFNAPGFNASTLAMVEVRKKLESLINSDTSILTADKIYEIISEIDQLSFKIGSTPFNPDSFNKLNPFYSSTGLELTSNDLVMFMPESVNKIPMFTTPQINPTATHGIGFLMESSALYDTLNSIMTGSLIENYTKITKILEDFEIHPLTIETLNTIGKYVSNFLGFSSQNLSDLFKYTSTLTSENLNKYIYNDISKLNYDSSSANLYALFNFIPFSISNVNDIFNNTTFDINKYTQHTIDERYNLFEKYQNLSMPTISNATLKNLNIHDTYKIIYEEDASSAYVIFDEFNKIILTNDSRSAAYSAELGDFSFYGDNFANIETTYLKNNHSTLFVNTLHNKVYDTYLDDYIVLNKGETSLDLSYGNDTINIDFSNGAIIKDIFIKDAGVGDLFIFNGGNGDDYIIGTVYKDKIIGAAGNDALFSGDGDDEINGGLGNDFIFGEDGDDILIGDDGNDNLMGGRGSNSLSGGLGNDTLNAYNTPDEYHDIRGDTLSGGAGTNKLFGTGYGDTYIYSKQDNGYDTIYENDKHFGVNYIDRLIFNYDTQLSEISLYNIVNDLVVAINGIYKIFIIDYYNNYSYLDEMHFTNSISGLKTIWNTNDILQHTIDTMNKNVIIGTNFADNITGTVGNDYIESQDGEDKINGGDGDDLIYGGSSNDLIHGNNGDDILFGDEDNDQLYGDAGNDLIYGGNGIDLIDGGTGNDTLYGDFGDDIIEGGDGNDYLYGGLGADILNGNAGNDIIDGGEGDDTINGDGGNDIIYAGDGNDIINNINLSINENDIIYAGKGNDQIYNYGYNIEINGDDGDDLIYLNIGNKNGIEYSLGSGTVRGGNGNDTIKIFNNFESNISSYIIEGGKGNDSIILGRGNHNIIYNKDDGNDTINTFSPNKIEDIKFTFNGILKNSVNIDSIQLDDKGNSVTITLDNHNSISLKNYFATKNFLNSINTFIFNDTILSNIDFKNIATNIIKAEYDGIFYDTVWSDKITGTNGNDTVILSKGTENVENLDLRDIVNSGNGDDKITIGVGNAIVSGNYGSDTIYNYGYNVEINGDDGDDLIYLNIGNKNGTEYSSGSGTVKGGDGNDTIKIFNTFESSISSYILEGGKGNDSIILGRGNHNIIYNKDDGNDTINTFSPTKIEDIKLIFEGISANIVKSDSLQLDNRSQDIIFKINDNNSITLKNYFSSKNFLNSISSFVFNGVSISNIDIKDILTNIKGTTGNDIIYDTVWEDNLNLIGGEDTVYLNNGNDILTTSNYKTNTTISSINNIINSNSGNDIFTFIKTKNTVNLTDNSGNDEIKISASTNELLSININISFNDVYIVDMKNNITLGWGNNTLTLNQSNMSQLILNFSNYSTNNILEFKNKISGNNNANILRPLTNDITTIYGNGGDDIITGGTSTDYLYGGSGNDNISGGAGYDYIYGETGDDHLYGGNGDFDFLYGGEGNDSYHLLNNNNANDFYGSNEVFISTDMYGKDLILTKTGDTINFRTTDESFNVNYTGSLNRIEKFSGLNNNTSYSLVGNEINRIFELQAALIAETDDIKIANIQDVISNLWKYDT